MNDIVKQIPLLMPGVDGNASLTIKYSVIDDCWYAAYGAHNARRGRGSILGKGSTIQESLENLIVSWESFKSAHTLSNGDTKSPSK